MIRISIFVLLAVCLFNSGVWAQDYDIYYLKYIKNDSGDIVKEETYLYKIKSDGSGDTPVESRPLSRMGYDWSPDKNYIAYRIYEDDGEILYIRDITKGTVSKICIFDGGPHLIHWAPDSSMLAVGFFSIMDDVPSKITLFRPDGALVKELPQQQEEWQKTSWSYFSRKKDQKSFYIKAMYTVNSNLLNSRFINKDILTGKELIIAEVVDGFRDQNGSWRKEQECFTDRYEMPAGEVKDGNVSVPDEVGDVYLNGQVIAAQKDFCQLSYPGYGFHYISSLPDGKLFLLLVCAQSEEMPIYLYDTAAKKLKLLSQGNEVSFRVNK